MNKTLTAIKNKATNIDSLKKVIFPTSTEKGIAKAMIVGGVGSIAAGIAVKSVCYIGNKVANALPKATQSEATE